MTIIFYNILTMAIIKRISAPEVEGTMMDFCAKFFKGGIYMENMTTGEDDMRSFGQVLSQC